MDIRNLIERLFLFLIGVPLVLALPIFFPQLNFLLLFIVCTVLVLIAIYEMHLMVNKKYNTYNFMFFLVIAVLDFILLYIFTFIEVNPNLYVLLFVIPIFALTLLELAISQKEGFKKSFERILTGVIIFLYPMILSHFFLFLTILPNPRISIAVFFSTVFSCDSLAWFFGMIFGDNNRGIIAASPKKSIAGFIGVAISVCALSFAVNYFLDKYFPSLLRTFIIIGGTSFAAVIGDLFESVLKRSINIKDSGAIILGRGGVLDTIDSMLFAVPAYFLLYSILV